jgi:hypothetical protein
VCAAQHRISGGAEKAAHHQADRWSPLVSPAANCNRRATSRRAPGRPSSPVCRRAWALSRTGLALSTHTGPDAATALTTRKRPPTTKPTSGARSSAQQLTATAAPPRAERLVGRTRPSPARHSLLVLPAPSWLLFGWTAATRRPGWSPPPRPAWSCAHLGHVGATGPHKGCRGESHSPLPVTYMYS